MICALFLKDFSMDDHDLTIPALSTKGSTSRAEAGRDRLDDAALPEGRVPSADAGADAGTDAGTARDQPVEGPRVHVDLDNLRANYRFIQSQAPQAEVAGVVKCDGYGMGAREVTAALMGIGCRIFYVAWAHEGRTLRRELAEFGGDEIEIRVFHGPTAQTLPLFAEYALTPVINTVAQATLWAQTNPYEPAVLHVDTGMNRLGLDVKRLDSVQSTGLRVKTLMSHLACAAHPDHVDDHHPMNLRQRAAFLQAAMRWPDAALSLSASGGVLLGGGYHYSEIRAGISLYGTSASGSPLHGLSPVASLKAPILQLRDVPTGAEVGYDASWVAPRASRLATLAIGYGDGYPRALSNVGKVEIAGGLCPIVGRISMDMLVVDVTDLGSGISNSLASGDLATLYGARPIIEDVAKDVDMVPYELLTNIGPRVRRIYHPGSPMEQLPPSPMGDSTLPSDSLDDAPDMCK